MRQKGWTPFTCIMIVSVSQRVGTQATLLGRNDNQVVVLKLPDKRKLIERGMSAGEFDESSKSVGQELKPGEKSSSYKLFEYSKNYKLYRTKESCSLTKARRIANESNDGILTLSSRKSSVSSGRAGVCKHRS